MTRASDFDGSGLHHVFAYGSLIWRPGFDYLDRQKGLLRGAHRSLCIYSHRYRGTPERPGLVFGLKHGGACHGVVFAIDPGHWQTIRDYLWAREMDDGVYRPARRQVVLANGERVEALAFVAIAGHRQYAGRLSLGEQAALVRSGRGSKGANIDYVLNTAQHLKDMGIKDRNLDRLGALLTRV